MKNEQDPFLLPLTLKDIHTFERFYEKLKMHGCHNLYINVALAKKFDLLNFIEKIIENYDSHGTQTEIRVVEKIGHQTVKNQKVY